MEDQRPVVPRFRSHRTSGFAYEAMYLERMPTYRVHVAAVLRGDGFARRYMRLLGHALERAQSFFGDSLVLPRLYQLSVFVADVCLVFVLVELQRVQSGWRRVLIGLLHSLADIFLAWLFFVIVAFTPMVLLPDVMAQATNTALHRA